MELFSAFAGVSVIYLWSVDFGVGLGVSVMSGVAASDCAYELGSSVGVH